MGTADLGLGSAVAILAGLGHAYWKRMGNLDRQTGLGVD